MFAMMKTVMGWLNLLLWGTYCGFYYERPLGMCDHGLLKHIKLAHRQNITTVLCMCAINVMNANKYSKSHHSMTSQLMSLCLLQHYCIEMVVPNTNICWLCCAAIY